MTRSIFKQLADYQTILVTGTQRSGTTIATLMLSKSLGHRAFSEERIGQSDLKKLDELVYTGIRSVIQCPALFYAVDKLSYQNTAVVVMRRNIVDIVRSQKRIGWGGGKEEIDRYLGREDFNGRWVRWIENSLNLTVSSPTVRYSFWELVQKEKMTLPYIELEYESLRWHPLWVSGANRSSFQPRQVTPFHKNIQEEDGVGQ